jgi:hypothetical protein
MTDWLAEWLENREGGKRNHNETEDPDDDRA